MPNRLIDLTGQKFGRLTVIERTKNDPARAPRWVCRCDCGNEKIVFGGHLRDGNVQSCGCLRREVVGARSAEIARRIGHDNTTHGMSKTRLYNIWHSMKSRCLNEKDGAYFRYGGRGITVCEEWLKFEPFRDWALSTGYREDLTIDRKDNDGPYSPDNCRWATAKEQANNRRYYDQRKWVTCNGETKTLEEWAKIYNIDRATIQRRLKKGYSIEEAITMPRKTHKHKKNQQI